MNTKRIAGTGIFAALTIVFTIISNYVAWGPISVNLSLVPVALAGILFGPLSGLICGLINGGIVLLAPSTFAVFYPISLAGTIVVCFIKSGMAGLLSALAYKLLRKTSCPDLVCMIIAAILAPVINTGLFFVGAAIFFNSIIGALASAMTFVNFAVEVTLSLVLAPSILKAIEKVKQVKNW